MAFEYNAAANHGTSEPDDILAPKHYASVRKNGQVMRALPLWAYTSERFWQAEKERIFLTSWNMLARAEIVPNAGDFQTMSFLGIQLIVARGNDGRVRVFANTCRHRGAKVADGKGNCKFFRCPYHFWTYNLDGSFIGAPQYNAPDGTPLIDASNKGEFGLVEVESGTWGGFVFIRIKPGKETLEEHLGVWVETLASHRLEDMRVARSSVYDMDANWKCFAENYIDAYHIPYVHKDSLALWRSERYVGYDTRGNEHLVFAVHDGSQLLLPMPGFDGFPAMPQIDADKKRGTYFSTLKPGVLMTLGNDGALVFQNEPISAGKSRLTVSSLFPKAYFERPDFERLSANYFRRNELVVAEDKDVSLRQYAGLQSPYARIARLCKDETMVHDFANWIVDRVVGPDRGAALAAE